MGLQPDGTIPFPGVNAWARENSALDILLRAGTCDARHRFSHRRFALDHARDQTLEIIFDSLDGSRRIYDLKSVLAGHPIEFLEQQFLISDKAVVIIISQTQIHSRLPVIETAARRQHARSEFFHRSEAQIKDRVRY